MKNKGFTLLEVLIALAVVAIAFAAFFNGFTAVIQNQRTLMHKTNALWVAENVMAELTMDLIKMPSNRSKLEGSVSQGSATYYYEILRMSTEDKDVIKYEISVFNPNRKKEITLIGFKNIDFST